MRTTKVRRRARELVRPGTRKLIRELGLKLKFFVQDDKIKLMLIRISSGKSIGLYEKDGIWETESIPGIPQYLIGLYMYEELIEYGLNRGLRVTSSVHGERNYTSNVIWEKLIHSFRIQDRESRYYVYQRK